MIVVSDTTPVISLLKIRKLELLKRMFGNVIIPHSVYEELTDNPRFSEEAETIKNAEFISVEKIDNKKEIETFGKAVGLDRGESEAILLSTKMSADLVLMDEAKGRQVARQLNLNVMGCIGILIAAYRNKFILNYSPRLNCCKPAVEST